MDIVHCLALACAIVLSGCSAHRDADTQNKTHSHQAESLTLEQPEIPISVQVYQLKSVQKSSGIMKPDFSWIANGQEIKFSEFTKGKAVFLNYWATWCPPCRREIPDIVELAKEYGDRVVFIGIALENEDKASEAEKLVKAYASKSNINYINLVGDANLVDMLASLYGTVQAIPTTFIFNRSGQVVQRIDGSADKQGFLQELRKAIE
ncbi:MAG: TlpA disulfide reductase family protein [Bacteroidota bacterium]|nr:TlpA family protein disulfide reductase [Candidatus Kapabacteria bacterium]MDW8221061.1 TlpA disulfide reductase family protein [Bacteroidota bacterium]